MGLRYGGVVSKYEMGGIAIQLKGLRYGKRLIALWQILKSGGIERAETVTGDYCFGLISLMFTNLMAGKSFD